jgi:hypothetical protein
MIDNKRLAQIRRQCAKRTVVNYDKPQINNILNALEDMANNADLIGQISQVMDAAAPSITLSRAQKVTIAQMFLLNKFGGV